MKVAPTFAGTTVCCPRCTGHVQVPGPDAGSSPSANPSKITPQMRPQPTAKPARGTRPWNDEWHEQLLQHTATQSPSPDDPAGARRELAQASGKEEEPGGKEDDTLQGSPKPQGKQRKLVAPHQAAASAQQKSPQRRTPPDLFGFSCPTCDTRLVASLSQAGQQITCPDCGTVLVVPQGKLPMATHRKSVTGNDQEKSEDTYPLRPPEDRRRLLPWLIEVSEAELLDAVYGPATAQPAAGGKSTAEERQPSVPPASAGERLQPPVGESRPVGLSPPPAWKVASRFDEAYHVACPLCDTRIMVWPAQEGQQVSCPDCTTPLVVPKRSEAPRDRTCAPGEFEDDIRFADEAPIEAERPRATIPASPAVSPNTQGTRQRRGTTGATRHRSSAAPGPPHGSRPSERPSPVAARSAPNITAASDPATGSSSHQVMDHRARHDARQLEEHASPIDAQQQIRRFLRTPYIFLLLRILGHPRLLLLAILTAVWASVLELTATALASNGLLSLPGIVTLKLFVVICLPVAMVWINTTMQLIESSAHGSDGLEGTLFPYPGEAAAAVLVMGGVFWVSCLPGILVAAPFLSQSFWWSPWIAAAVLLVSECVCFPVMMLSHLSSEHFGDFFCPEVVYGLWKRKGAWLRYGLTVAGCWGATILPLVVGFNYTFTWVALLWSVTGCVHGRALGVLAAELTLDSQRAVPRRGGARVRR